MPPTMGAQSMENIMSKVVFKEVDMKQEVRDKLVSVTADALTKFQLETDVAAEIKKQFDKLYEPTWHVIVGRSFGSYVTHESGAFAYFYYGQVAILVFKSG
eukprot:105185_1